MSAPMHKWEPLTTWRHGGHEYTTCRRMRVPGGWLYEVLAYNYTTTICGPDEVRVVSIAATFVPEVTPC